ncbi:Transmembrane protein 145 [Strongyloides ratti]|uniref:Transmembrane protein 145 n=1 Tax=Strongyloides ratti TaxID=34506 RepID=A0A090KXR2_STRRB|nr:Transmembrane protein 145 [Strongyloides ratti]CEF60038.1 Transmembrane protein 145 [Strongyloides ratti]
MDCFSKINTTKLFYIYIILNIFIINKISSKYVEGRFFIPTNWYYLDKFCFVSETSKLTYNFKYPTEFGTQVLYLYYDTPDQWLTAYNHELTCEEKASIATKRNNQIVPMVKSENSSNYGAECDIITLFNSTWYNCSGSKRFISARPRWWFFAIANCNSSHGLYLEYSMLMVNRDDPASWFYHFSYDEFYILISDIIFIVINVIILSISLFVAFVLKNRHLFHQTYKLFLKSQFVEILSLICMCIYYSRYAKDGHSIKIIKVMGYILRGCSSSIFLFLLLLISKGFTITRARISNSGTIKIMSVMALYLLIYFIMLFWSLEIFDRGIVYHMFESLPGYMFMGLRIIAWIWFLRCCIITIKKYPIKKKFYCSFIPLVSVWFLSGATTLVISNFWLDNWVREEVVNFVDCALITYGHLGFLFLTLPSSANQNFPYHVRTTQVCDINYPTSNYELNETQLPEGGEINSENIFESRNIITERNIISSNNIQNISSPLDLEHFSANHNTIVTTQSSKK